MSRFVRRGPDFYNARHITRIELDTKEVRVHLTEKNTCAGGWLWFSGAGSRVRTWSFDSADKAEKWATELAHEINML